MFKNIFGYVEEHILGCAIAEMMLSLALSSLISTLDAG